ncbi:hypothetical protein LV457_02965 [Mycobacterium sp. MYCO198283]|uniref:hypothetical protein n=1 Tax=Mycobacterium sp. MYCO198283 TaxID=2883505 RepID=UPI001E4BB592|nr:hypothetical protein [Mycobacterium sp. MYCO198283]MCG5431251.1 hypothetical protein [Mycobacterium sp. MYCO198283]
MRLLARLDAYGLDWPSSTEGHPEDRCGLCGDPVVDHPAVPVTRWRHRLHAALDLLMQRKGWP